MFDDERLVTVEVPGHECDEAHLYDSARQAVLVTTDCPMDHVYEIVPDAADRCKARVRLLAVNWGNGETDETAARPSTSARARSASRGPVAAS